MIKFLLKLYNSISINNFDSELINKVNISQKKSEKLILIQCPNSKLYCRSALETISKCSSNNLKGISPNFSHFSLLEILMFFPYFGRVFMRKLYRRKWRKIYRSNGIKEIFYPYESSLFNRIKYILVAISVYKKILNKKQLVKIEIEGIKCGDLIYDSYIRFNSEPTVNLKSWDLIIYIYDTISQIKYYSKLVKNLSPKAYISSYSTYISHGIPVRVFLKQGVEVYTTGYRHEKVFNFPIKKLTKLDYSQEKPHWEYRKIFKDIPYKQKLIKKGLKKFSQRFSGNNDMHYMNNNQYKLNYKSPDFNYDLDGIVFIGDLFDSLHIYRSLIFNDLYEWLIFTIEFVLKNKLNFGFKEHPNQLEISKKTIKKIKNLYPSIHWIDSSVSNKLIFNSKIKVGVSVWGSVIPELAFHKINVISCGDNPTSEFKIAHQPKSINEYCKLLLDFEKLNQNINVMDEIGEFYYMNNMHEFNFREP